MSAGLPRYWIYLASDGDRLNEQGLHFVDRIAATGEQMDKVLAALLTRRVGDLRLGQIRAFPVKFRAPAAGFRQREQGLRLLLSVRRPEFFVIRVGRFTARANDSGSCDSTTRTCGYSRERNATFTVRIVSGSKAVSSQTPS